MSASIGASGPDPAVCRDLVRVALSTHVHPHHVAAAFGSESDGRGPLNRYNSSIASFLPRPQVLQPSLIAAFTGANSNGGIDTTFDFGAVHLDARACAANGGTVAEIHTDQAMGPAEREQAFDVMIAQAYNLPLDRAESVTALNLLYERNPGLRDARDAFIGPNTPSDRPVSMSVVLPNPPA